MAKKSTHYNEQDIDVLKGLEPVQVRPGMYTTTENPNHIIQEVVDNAQDEALAGFANLISVELHEDGSVTIEDNGRGIPCGIHPKEKKPVIEVVFTHLHAGGKFKKGEGQTYGFTGGLHGVGVSVTNALSDKMDVTVFRDGFEHNISFENGKVSSPLRKKKLDKENKDKTGTKVHAHPNPKYFDNPSLNAVNFEEYLLAKAVLLRGTKVVWRRPNKPEKVWEFENGMQQYLSEQSEGNQWFAPFFVTEQFYGPNDPNFSEGEGFELVVGWGEGKSTRESYVNLIHTKEGGRHESGLKAGLLDAFRKVAERTGALPKNIKLEAEDVWSNISYVLSVKLMDPQFQNQTKDKMTSKEAHRLVSDLLSDKMELYLNDNPSYAKALLDVMVQNAIARSKQGAKIERRKSSSGLVLPGKLADCLGNDVNSSELFLVEGDSAAGSSKSARDKETQAILPLRGKILNTWEVDHHKLMSSEGIANIASAVGVDPLSWGDIDKADLSKLRYGKVFIMADADVDGQHIQVLLLTLFVRHFPALIKNGHIWIAQAPLFRIDAPAKKGAKGGPRKLYALDDDERESMIAQLEREGLKEGQYTVSRFKGLGEMNADQLGETTMSKETRRALKITLNDIKTITETFDRMMGGKNAKQRKEWMEEKGADIDVD